MRTFSRLLLLLLLFAAIFPFTYPWRDGKPLLNWSDIGMPASPSIELPELTLPGEGESRAAHQPVTLYRWQEGDGGIHFGNEPPPAGVTYEVIEVNPDANTVQKIGAGERGERSATD